MAQDELEKLLDMFKDGSGFGDPEARRNAERLQVLLAKGQQKTANRLNNVAVLAFQVWRK